MVLGADGAQHVVTADASGHVRLPRTPGAIRAGVLPASLREPKARWEYCKQHGDNDQAIGNEMLATVAGEATAGNELRLRLVVPPAAGY